MPSPLLDHDNNGTAACRDPEVLEKPVRRQFTAAYKLEIVEAAERCTELGQIGALLRREGLYSSQLSTWRNQRHQGQLQALSDHKRGRKATIPHPVQKELEQLRRENQRLRHTLQQAELIIDIQKKASQLMGISLSPINRDEPD
jgi:transposase-like protein